MKTDRYVIVILFTFFYTHCFTLGFAQVESPQHPSIYWIDMSGCLHRLVDTQGSVPTTSDPADAAEAKVKRILALLGRVENLVPGVKNTTSLAVDITREKLYWTEKTGDRRGRIRRANLDGTNVELVKDLTSVPYGIALDTANGKIYLTNSWGKVQRLNLNGSNFKPNLITDLKSPKSLALDVSGGKVYWIEQTSDRTGKIRRANLDGTNVELVKDLTSAPRGIALDTTNGKIYLTNSWGKVQRLNLDGSNFKPNLITDLKSPTGIAVDTVNQKLYWTEEVGIKCANLDGTAIQNVVPGLGTPIRIALGGMHTDAGIAAAPTTVRRVPDATALRANYPNPFNPETWIPYHLAQPADVTVSIYAADGRLVRTLDLGHRSVGVYESRSRAVYWDGRNTLGEPVASGVYFYTLTAGEFRATRKMLIRK